MKQVGIQPQIIYAYEKCEFLVTEMNRHLIDAEQMAEWEGRSMSISSCTVMTTEPSRMGNSAAS